MARATYYLDFELSYNTWTNLAADWRAADPLIVERGIEPGEHIAGVGRMTFALHNPDGRYTPGHASVRPGFDVGIGVRLRASDGTNTRTLFYGRLAAIEAAQRVDVPYVRLTVEDDLAATHRRQLEAFPLALNAAPGDVVGRLVDASFTPPGVFGYWRLGHAQASLLGASSKLSDSTTGKGIDAGQSIFPWVGDTWRGATAFAALHDVAISEGGQFFIAADGMPVFADRHVRSKRVTADATLSSGLADLRVERIRERVANEVVVTVYPRDVGASPEVLWTASAPVRLVPGQPRVALCRYADPDQQAASVGAQNVIAPVPGVDFTATYDAAGLGADISSQVTVTCEAGASAARITLTTAPNTFMQPVYVHQLRLRGTALRAFQPVTVQRADETSRFAYGHQPLQLALPLQEDAAAADDRATALLAQRKDPRPWLVVQVEATASALMLADALARDIGERLHLTEAALALSAAPCFIDGVRHEIAGGGARHRVTWRTSPAGLHAYWLLGQSGYGELGTASRLGW